MEVAKAEMKEELVRTCCMLIIMELIDLLSNITTCLLRSMIFYIRFLYIFQMVKPITYEFVERPPILENVQMDDDVNAFKFPNPFCHENKGVSTSVGISDIAHRSLI